MKIEFLPITHTKEEIEMGHCLRFNKSPKKMVISATANWNGFTPLNAVARSYGWDYDLIEAAAKACNESGEVAVITQLNPFLLLVPKTNNDKNLKSLFVDLIEAVNSLGVEELHLTHFGFVQSKLAINEINEILTMLENSDLETSLNKIYFDIDSRVQADVISYYKNILKVSTKGQVLLLES